MKKFIILCLALCAALSLQAQELPYSKYLGFSKEEFRENKFKYNERTNTWYLHRVNGLNVTFNVLAILADASEDIRPAMNDYTILVQMGEEEQAASVRVIFYNDETYHKILTFMKTKATDLVETSSGRLIRNHAAYEGYELELNMDQQIISRTSARTADYKTVKNVDESYNEYEFVIQTDVEPWSKYFEKLLKKQAKRDAKGRKKTNVNDMM
jgi:hypothetical protein